MMEHCRHLIREWDGGTVILSPRDLDAEQLIRFASSVHPLSGGKVLLDPQFYLPHADHARLCEHSYWPEDYSTNAFWEGPALAILLRKLSLLNVSVSSEAFILPGVLAAAIDADWLKMQRAILTEATALAQPLPLYMTIALSAEATRNTDQVTALMDAAESWSPAGYYLVFEHPNGDYLVEDPIWLANVLDIVAGLKLRGAKVIVGYCNHQMLVCACAKADFICSGTWMNVRSFPPDKFRSSYEEEIKQRTTWYYCPQSLSEYKILTLDLALRLGVLQQLRPVAALDNPYIAPLFSGPQPSSVGFAEPAAFRHYLHCLRLQSLAAAQDTFDDTVAAHHSMLDAAEQLLRTLSRAGISGQQRDFREIVGVNRGALAALVTTRGPLLRRRWTTL